MRKQAFGKFLSNKGLKEAIQAENEVKPYIANSSAQGKKQKKKRSSQGAFVSRLRCMYWRQYY